jgi:hypothetical protein
MVGITGYSHAQKKKCTVLDEKISTSYTGKCQDGLAHGKGKATGEDSYKGFFHEGLPHGQGKYLYKNGDVYQGSWKNGLKEGEGKLVYYLNGKKRTLRGIWENDNYIGDVKPDASVKVKSVLGITNYQVEEGKGEDDQVVFSIKLAFSDFIPEDLMIDKSSGQIIQSAKKFEISQYNLPLHCEIRYSIMVGNIRKLCRFNFEVVEKGSYSITLNND